MDEQVIFELVHEAVSQALERQAMGRPLRLHKRMVGGRVLFEDDQGREVKAIPVEQLFKKVTGIRDKLRVMEQKINASGLGVDEKAELQDALTRCYGSLTTFNFLFEDEGDKFKGTGG